jgi:Leucine-rich repeat (LRR) protein
MQSRSLLTKEKVDELLGKNKSDSNKLEITNSSLSQIAEDAFVNIGTKIEILNLSNNEVASLGANPFKPTTLSHLKKLVLSFNPISSLNEENTFSSLKSLEEFELTNSNLKSINEKAFNGLSNLKRLILAYNQLECIEERTFSGLVKLELLVLSFNKLSTIHKDTFASLGKLQRLNLKANKLNALNPSLFHSLVECEQFILSVNELSSIDNIFVKCTRLSRLFIHTNKFEKLTAQTFQGLQSCCVFIDIGNNLITHLDPLTFAGLGNLEYLDLSKNQLKHLDKSLFADLTKLDELILSKNLISSIQTDLFRTTCQLKVLKFDFNKITFIDTSVFSSLASLTEIYCNTLSVSNMKALQENIIKLNKDKFLQDINCIVGFKETDKMLESVEAFKAIDRISLFTNRHKIELFKLIETKTLKRFTKVVTFSFNFIFNNLAFHIAKYKPMINRPECLVLKFLNAFTAIIKNWSNTFALFCSQFFEYSGVAIVLNYINSPVLQQSILDKISDDSRYLFMILLNIYGSLLSTLYNLMKKEDKKFKAQIVELNAFESLIKVVAKFENISDFRFLAYLCLSGLVDDRNVSNLANLNLVIGDLAEYTKVCTKRLQDDVNLDRCPLVLEDTADAAEVKKEALVIQVNESYFYITDFLGVLYNFAISDDIKYQIYEKCKMKDYLEVLVVCGNLTEEEFALKLLWQLCFDSRICNDLRKRTRVVSKIEELVVQKETKESKQLICNAKGIQFLLNKEKSGELESFDRKDKNEKATIKSMDGNYIMISYNSKSRDVCLEIKRFLESSGFKVWIDVESIYGSSLEAMATAIEQSFCVLLCITEKYTTQTHL